MLGKQNAPSTAEQRRLLELAEAAADRVYRDDAANWLALLDDASGALQSAVGHAAAADDGDETCARLVAALWPYWRLRDRSDAARKWLTTALDRSTAPAMRARLLVGAGVLAFEDGDIRTARVSWAELLGIGNEFGDPTAEALGLAGLSLVAHRLGDPLRADVLGRSSLARSDGGASPFAGIVARLVRGRTLLGRNNVAAGALFTDAERLAADADLPGLRGYALLGGAWAASQDTDRAYAVERANGLAADARAIFEAHADAVGLDLCARFDNLADA